MGIGKDSCGTGYSDEWKYMHRDMDTDACGTGYNDECIVGESTSCRLGYDDGCGAGEVFIGSKELLTENKTNSFNFGCSVCFTTDGSTREGTGGIHAFI